MVDDDASFVMTGMDDNLSMILFLIAMLIIIAVSFMRFKK